MAYYLGIDGGGTKTTCAVGDESLILATATSGPSNIVRVGEAKARESLQQAVRQACAAAGIAFDQIFRTCVGGSGAARPELAELVRRIMAEVLPTPVDVVGDMQTALEAAFGAGPGVVVIAGTGSIAYGRDSHGQTARAGGWGFAIGDEGSAHWIGRSIVSALLRASDEDEQAATSPLATEIFRAWGIRSLSDLARAANSIPPPDFAALFPAVARCNEPLADKVLSSAGRELAQTALVVVRKLFPDANCVPVAISGGVFRHAARVCDVFYNELQHLDRRVEVNRNVVDPVEGALRIARRTAPQHAGAHSI